MTIDITRAGFARARTRHTRRQPYRLVLLLALVTVALLAGDLLVATSGHALPGPQGLPGTAPATARAAQTDGSCSAGWRELPIPDGTFISTPFDIVSREGEPAWILGGASRGILALRWDGSAWVPAGTSAGGQRGLVGGALLGDDLVLGVGYYRKIVGEGEGAMEPISGRLTSAYWKAIDVPDPAGPRAMFADVAALPDGGAWAVGTRLEDGLLRAYAARWAGARWRASEPEIGGAGGLTAVERAPGGTIWAVGWRAAGRGVLRPAIVRHDGKAWRTVEVPRLPHGVAVLTDVAFLGAREGYAVGYLAVDGSDRHEAILLRWDGRRWERQPLPWAGDAAAIPRSVAVGADGTLWIAGAQTPTDQREARGFVARRSAGHWSLDVLGVPDGVRSEVMAVAASPRGALIAASVAASLLIMETCATGTGTARAGDGKGSRMKVSRIQARRRTGRSDAAEDWHGGPSADRGAFVPADAKVQRVGKPVPPKGFVIEDRAAATGLAQVTETFGGFVADLDGNGYQDVFYSRHGGTLPRLAMNGPGGFSDAPSEAFSPVDRHGCDHADVDRDGNQDILCSVGAQRGKSIRRHELSLAPDKPGGRLVRGALGISDPLGRGRHVAFIRLDKDAWPDVFIGNAPDREDGLPSSNRFYRNAKGTFVPAPEVGLDGTHGTLCARVGDVDGDGDQDLAYCTAYDFAGRPAGLRLMVNRAGRLVDRTRAQGISPIGDIGVAFADVDGDGRQDLLQVAPSLLRVSRATKTGYRRIFEARLSAAVAVAAGDVDGDGRADIYIASGDDDRNSKDLLLLSKRGGRAFTSVRIPQTAEGLADDVIALDHDRNGRTDFVVLNGRQKAGPVQLLAAFPS